MKTHRATEERTLYALSVAKGGPKIKPTAPGDCWVHDNESQPLPPAGAENLPACGNLIMNWNGGNRVLVSTGVLVPNFLTGILSPLVGRYVINKTGLEGRFNIPLEFAPDDDTPGGLSGLAWSRREGATPASGPSIFKALEELGLKLEPTKAPAEYSSSIAWSGLEWRRRSPHVRVASIRRGPSRPCRGRRVVPARRRMLAVNAPSTFLVGWRRAFDKQVEMKNVDRNLLEQVFDIEAKAGVNALPDGPKTPGKRLSRCCKRC